MKNLKNMLVFFLSFVLSVLYLYNEGIDNEEKVMKKKVTKNKTRVYIDENGVEHVIKEDVEQIIRTL